MDGEFKDGIAVGFDVVESKNCTESERQMARMIKIAMDGINADTVEQDKINQKLAASGNEPGDPDLN